MSSSSQHPSAQVINAALEVAKFVKRTTENVALLDPLKVPANTLIAILECTRVSTSMSYWKRRADALMTY
jgi:hypothetical protein